MKVPDDFSIIDYIRSGNQTKDFILLTKEFQALHLRHRFDIDSIKEKFMEECLARRDKEGISVSRASGITMTKLDFRYLPMHKGSYISHIKFR